MKKLLLLCMLSAVHIHINASASESMDIDAPEQVESPLVLGGPALTLTNKGIMPISIAYVYDNEPATVKHLMPEQQTAVTLRFFGKYISKITIADNQMQLQKPALISRGLTPSRAYKPEAAKSITVVNATKNLIAIDCRYRSKATSAITHVDQLVSPESNAAVAIHVAGKKLEHINIIP